MTHEPERIDKLIEAISDSQEIDWEAEERAAGHPSTARVVHELAFIARLANAHRSLDATEEDVPFPTWGHLRLVARIGSGSYGEVFRAWDETLQREVALKLYHPGPKTDVLRLNALLAESRTLAKISHENVVRVLGADLHKDRVGFWMEFLSGQTLEELLESRGTLDAREASDLGVKVCRGLSAVHAAGVIHRDIKPANVFRETGGRICLLDFGAGTAIQDSIQKIGTPLYMAPETWLRGESSKRSDVYSVGALLFHMVTKRLPLEAGSPDELAAKHARNDRLSLAELRPDLPMEFRKIVQRCLEPEATNRFASAGQVEEALTEFLASRSSRRIRWLNVALLGVLTALLATQVPHKWLSRVGGSRAVSTRVLVLPSEVSGQNEGADYLGAAFAEAIAINLANAKGLEVLPVPKAGPNTQKDPLALSHTANAMHAGRILTSQLARDGDSLRASVSLIDSDRNAIVWGTQRNVAFAALPNLTSSLADQIVTALGHAIPRLYDHIANVTGGAEMARSPLVSQYVGLWRSGGDLLPVADRVVQEFPKDPDAYALRVWALTLFWIQYRNAGTEALEKGLADLDRADPNNPYTEIMRSMIESDADGRPRAANERLRRVLSRRDLRPTARAWILRLMAQRSSQLGDNSEALARAQEALQLDPANAATYYVVSTTLNRLKRHDEALTRARQAWALGPYYSGYKSIIGTTLRLLGRYAEGEKELREACRMGETQDPYTECAIVLELEGHKAEAHAFAAHADSLPPDAYGMYNLSRYSALAGEQERALLCLQRALKLGFADRSIEAESDLASLSGDPRFAQIVAEVHRRTQ